MNIILYCREWEIFTVSAFNWAYTNADLFNITIIQVDQLPNGTINRFGRSEVKDLYRFWTNPDNDIENRRFEQALTVVDHNFSRHDYYLQVESNWNRNYRTQETPASLFLTKMARNLGHRI